MKSHNHYEVAFEDFLRSRQMPYVAVDEAKRAAFRDVQLKSFDFIVYSPRQTNWLTDVKGRRWGARGSGKRSFENWVTQADIDGLSQWESLFGVGFRALLVFAYAVDADAAAPPEIVHAFREARYVFAGVPLDDYARHARVRSPKWGTVNMPTAEFTRHVRPMTDWL